MSKFKYILILFFYLAFSNKAIPESNGQAIDELSVDIEKTVKKMVPFDGKFHQKDPSKIDVYTSLAELKSVRSREGIKQDGCPEATDETGDAKKEIPVGDYEIELLVKVKGNKFIETSKKRMLKAKTDNELKEIYSDFRMFLNTRVIIEFFAQYALVDDETGRRVLDLKNLSEEDKKRYSVKEIALAQGRLFGALGLKDSFLISYNKVGLLKVDEKRSFTFLVFDPKDSKIMYKFSYSHLENKLRKEKAIKDDSSFEIYETNGKVIKNIPKAITNFIHSPDLNEMVPELIPDPDNAAEVDIKSETLNGNAVVGKDSSNNLVIALIRKLEVMMEPEENAEQIANENASVEVGKVMYEGEDKYGYSLELLSNKGKTQKTFFNAELTRPGDMGDVSPLLLSDAGRKSLVENSADGAFLDNVKGDLALSLEGTIWDNKSLTLKTGLRGGLGMSFQTDEDEKNDVHGKEYFAVNTELSKKLDDVDFFVRAMIRTESAVDVLNVYSGVRDPESPGNYAIIGHKQTLRLSSSEEAEKWSNVSFVEYRRKLGRFFGHDGYVDVVYEIDKKSDSRVRFGFQLLF